MNYLLYLILLIVFISYKIVDRVHYTRKAKAYGCKPAKQVPYKTPFGLFGIEFLLYLKYHHDRGRAHEGLDAIFEKLNTTTIATTVGIEPDVFTAEPENIRHMVSTSHTSEFNLGVRLEVFSLLLGDGIFSSEGTSWKHSRMMLRPFFTRESIKQIQSMEPFVQDIIKAIKQAQEKTIDMQEIFQDFTMDYSTYFLLGESCDCLKTYLGEPTNGSITSEAKTKFAETFDKGADYMLWKLMAGQFHTLYQPRQLFIYIKNQHDFVDYYVKKALNMSEKDLQDSSNDGTTFLYDLAQQTKDPKVLRDEILSIIVAGRSTTSALMTFLFLELGLDPNVFERLKDIIRVQFPDVESITFESIQRCEYLRWCINETLRYHPPVPYNARNASVDTILPKGGGEDNESPVFVKKGTKIVYPLWTAHRMEKYFGKDTYSFNPDRWGSLHANGGVAFMPFGAGPRNCLGQQLALLETSYVTIRLLQTFDSIKLDMVEVKKKSTATMVLMDGLPKFDMSVKGTPIAHLHQDQQQQQHADLSLWRERTTSRSTQNLNHHRHHHHHISSQLGLDQEPNHHVANSNSQNMLHGLTNSHSTTQHTTEIIAMSSPRGRDQSEEAEERGRSRLREDKLDVTDDSFDDISLMGFKTGSKHNSPVKMKKVR